MDLEILTKFWFIWFYYFKFYIQIWCYWFCYSIDLWVLIKIPRNRLNRFKALRRTLSTSSPPKYVSPWVENTSNTQSPTSSLHLAPHNKKKIKKSQATTKCECKRIQQVIGYTSTTTNTINSSLTFMFFALTTLYQTCLLRLQPKNHST